MKSNEKSKWEVFIKTADADSFTLQEKQLCAATEALDFMQEQGWKDVAKLPDEIEAADCLWLDKYELEAGIKNLAAVSAISVDSQEVQAIHAFLIENHDKTWL